MTARTSINAEPFCLNCQAYSVIAAQCACQWVGCAFLFVEKYLEELKAMKIPEILLWSSNGEGYNHLYLKIPKEYSKDEVLSFFGNEFTAYCRREMIDLFKKCDYSYDSISLYLDDYKAIRTYYLEEDDEDYELEGDQQWFADSNENTTDKYGDEIGFYWDFDPYDFSEYGFEVQEKEYGFLITFNRFGYSTDEMPEEIFSSDAIKYSLDSLLKKYPDVAYYRYEGCVVIFHNTNETINEEYYSSENEIPETDDYIGERMSSLDWDEVINSFSEYDEDINEETAKELIEFVEKYKDYIGDENISAIKEALKEYCSDKDDE